MTELKNERTNSLVRSLGLHLFNSQSPATAGLPAAPRVSPILPDTERNTESTNSIQDPGGTLPEIASGARDKIVDFLAAWDDYKENVKRVGYAGLKDATIGTAAATGGLITTFGPLLLGEAIANPELLFSMGPVGTSTMSSIKSQIKSGVTPSGKLDEIGQKVSNFGFSNKASTYLWGVAMNAYDDLVNEQADLINQDFLPSGVNVTVAGYAAAASNMLPAGRIMRGITGVALLGTGGVIVSQVAKSAGKKAAKKAAVGGSQNLGKTIMERTKNLIKIGKFADAADPHEEAARLVMDTHYQIAETLAERAALRRAQESAKETARRGIETELVRLGKNEQVTATNPLLPTSAFDRTYRTSLPDNVIKAARTESATRAALKSSKESLKKAEKDFPTLPTTLRKRIPKEPAKTIESEAKYAAQQMVDGDDEVFKTLGKETLEAMKATKGRRVPSPIRKLPENVPEFAAKAARQYVHDLQMSRMAAAERSISLKRILGGDEPSGKELREDLIFYIQGTGNPYRNKIIDRGSKTATKETRELNYVEDTFKDVEKRILAHPNGKVAIEEAKKARVLLDALYKALSVLRLETGSKELDYVTDYLHQVWRLKGLRKKGTAELDREAVVRKFVRDDTERLPTTTSPVEHTRSYKTFKEGIDNGEEPRTLDFAVLMQITEENFGKISALRKLLKDMAEVKYMPDGNPSVIRALSDNNYRTIINKLPGDAEVNFNTYRRVASGMLQKAVPGDKGHVYVHKDLLRYTKNILKPGRADEAIDTVSAISKRSIFGLSIFHAMTLTESAIHALGPVEGMRTAAKLGFGIPGLAQKVGGAKGLKKLLGANTPIDEATRLSSYHGVTIGAPQTDILRSKWELLMESSIDALYKGDNKLTKKAAKTLEGYRWLQRTFDVALWDDFHHPMKVYAFNNLYQNILSIKKGNASIGRKLNFLGLSEKKLKNISDDDIGAAVASYVNDEFGGQNFLAHSSRIMQGIADPNILKTLRTVFTSPDWNISAIRAGFAVTQLFNPGAIIDRSKRVESTLLKTIGPDLTQGLREFHNPIRGALGLRHWKNAGLVVWGYANMINKVLSGKYIWENEKDRKKFHIDTGVKDRDGRRMYISFEKQLKDVFRLFLGFFPAVHQKTQPFIQKIIGFENPKFKANTRRILEAARQEAIDLDGPVGDIAQTAMWGASIASGFAPFSLSSTLPAFQAEDIPGAALIAIQPLPVSKGVSPEVRIPDLRKAIERDDDDQFYRIIDDLEDNGFEAKRINAAVTRARNAAKKRTNLGDLLIRMQMERVLGKSRTEEILE